VLGAPTRQVAVKLDAPETILSRPRGALARGVSAPMREKLRYPLRASGDKAYSEPLGGPRDKCSRSFFGCVVLAWGFGGKGEGISEYALV
jgi:hypothetical protein